MTADVRYITRLRCDHPGCRNRWPADKPSVHHWEYARKRAAEDGWTYHVIRGDFCPDHAQKGGHQ